jgi:hypothetical protein
VPRTIEDRFPREEAQSIPTRPTGTVDHHSGPEVIRIDLMPPQSPVVREEPATHWLYVSFGSRPVCGFAAFDELWTRFPANCATRKGVIPYP